jgi:hypothetical protein
VETVRGAHVSVFQFDPNSAALASFTALGPSENRAEAAGTALIQKNMNLSTTVTVN